jgi:hypothetical protein
MKASEWINDGASTSAAGAAEPMQVHDVIASVSTPGCIDIGCVRSPIMKTHWAAASARFTTTFVNNPVGHKCDVCDRLWFLRLLKPPKGKHLTLLSNTLPEEAVDDFKLCGTCRKSLDSDKVPTLSRSNGFVYPPKQHGLPALDPIIALKYHRVCHSCRYANYNTLIICLLPFFPEPDERKMLPS